MAEFAGGPLTILFSDVEGSTDLRTERGDAAAHRILRSHEDVVRRCVAAHAPLPGSRGSAAVAVVSCRNLCGEPPKALRYS